MAAKQTRQQGFTLIELLVTLAILAVLAALTWRGIDGMVRAQSINQGRAAQVGTLQMGMLQWRADLDAVTGGETPQALEWSGAALRLTRIDTAEPDNALRVVAWSLSNIAGQDQWCRWQSGLIRSRAQWQAAWVLAGHWVQKSSAATPIDASGCIAIVPVQSWQVYFYRGDAWSNAASSADTGRLVPDGIRLQLVLDKGHPLGGTLTQDWVRPNLSGNKS